MGTFILYRYPFLHVHTYKLSKTIGTLFHGFQNKHLKHFHMGGACLRPVLRRWLRRRRRHRRRI